MKTGNMEQIFFAVELFPDYNYTLFTDYSPFYSNIFARVQKTTYFLCMRRRIVSSRQRETNWFHWSRIILRTLDYKKVFS